MENIGSGRTQRGCSGEVLEAHEEELNLGLMTCIGGMGGGRVEDGEDDTLKGDRGQAEEDASLCTCQAVGSPGRLLGTTSGMGGCGGRNAAQEHQRGRRS